MKPWPFLLLLTSCQAVILLAPKNPDYFGSAVTFQKQNVLGEYDFGYTEGKLTGSTFRRETGDAFGNKVGSYGLRVADGSVRVVNYIADANGFRAEITSNEPGVAPQNPASAIINKPALLPYNAAPPIAVAPAAPVGIPPPPPPPAAVAVRPKVFPPPPLPYNYIAPAPAPVALPPPPPPAYFPPRYTPVAPIAAPVAKGLAAYPPPPPPVYYTNLVQGKGYVNAYTNLFPPLSPVPPQYNYLSIKSPLPYQDIGIPL